MTHFLSVHGLSIGIEADRTLTEVVRAASFSLERGKSLGLVGETGSGKTLTALAIMGLVSRRGGVVTAGSVQLGGRELVGLGERDFRALRGATIGYISQQPRRSLNPALKIGAQIARVYRAHTGVSRRAAQRRAVELLDRVGIPRAASRAEDYPHMFSGGMCQRVMIAMAVCCSPELLIADEPTTALDVTVQERILELLKDMQSESEMSVLLITHDLAVVSEFCDSVAVMYCGEIVETGEVARTFAAPRHPYTDGLIRSVPGPDREALISINGLAPPVGETPPGCPFHPRCDRVIESLCATEEPPLVRRADGSTSRCHRSAESA